MDRRRKPKKSAEAKRPLVRKPPTDDSAKVRDLQKGLVDAHDQQKATAEILRIISGAPTELQPVLDAIARNAALVCGAYDAVVFLREGDRVRCAAHYGPINITLQHTTLSRGSVTDTAILDRQPVHVHDLLATEPPAFPLTAKAAREGGFRTTLSVPLLRENEAIGALAIRRREVQPFTAQQVALLQTFADQAVIAIENARLLSELHQKNEALTQAHAQVTEALEQQTATSEILRVISQSPTDVQPVFETIAERAMHLCDANQGIVMRFDGEFMQLAALANFDTKSADAMRRVFPTRPDHGSALGRVVLTKAVAHIPSMLDDPQHTYGDLARQTGFRSVVAVPMLKGDRVIGGVAATRLVAGPFSGREIALLQTFADQAVIAIENVRLFKELEARNYALTESLDQQTATSEILRVISSSPTDTQPVFDAIAESAARLCSANDAQVLRMEGDILRLVAACGTTSMPSVRRLTRGHLVGRAAIDRRTIYVRDLDEALAEYPETTAAQYGVQSALAVPLLRKGVALGVIRISRTEIRPFTDKQIALLQTFADQAVIAIENVRLFKELQARTGELQRSVEQLTALGEVGQAVSSTLDLETVLTTIVSRAVQLTGLDGGVVFEYDGETEEFIHRASTEAPGPLEEARRDIRLRKGEGVVGPTALTLEPAQVLDITVAGAYESPLRENLIQSGVRALLAVPMVRESRLIGSLVVSRNRPGAFPAETIELLRTFATQSALAIQNARLFREIEDKSRQLEVASQHKSEFLANMSHELRTPLNAILGFSEILAQGMFGAVNERQSEYLQDILESGRHLLSLINDILDLSKVEAGKMELEVTDFDLPSAIDNALTLVRERVTRRGITLGRAIDDRAGLIQGDERKVKQVLLNLLSNAIKFTLEGGHIEARAAVHEGLVEVSVTDTGVGIAPEDQEAVFEEFRQVGTAEKKVEGTGLGLALCRKFVELHGGRIWVKSEVGQGSTFTFTLPVRREG